MRQLIVETASTVSPIFVSPPQAIENTPQWLSLSAAHANHLHRRLAAQLSRRPEAELRDAEI